MKKMNIADLETPIGQELSFFSNIPFEFEGTNYTSVESFVQSLKFEDEETKKSVALLESHKARMRGKKRTKALLNEPMIVWGNQKIELFTDEYYEMLYSVILHKFKTNERARTFLLVTDSYDIYFDNGYPEPVFNTLPYDMYINMLTIAREDIKNDLAVNSSRIYKRPTSF